MDKAVDILIVGGGLVGASLMLALDKAGFNVILTDAKPFLDEKYHSDARTLALSPASIQILNMLKVWDEIKPQACPINTVHVSQKNHFGHTKLQNKTAEPLGFVVEMPFISSAIYKNLPKTKVMAPATLLDLNQQENIATLDKEGTQITIKPKLIVAADGANSKIRQLCKFNVIKKEYNQSALVTNITLTRSHNNIAYERFTKSGPMAMLPKSHNQAALIWAQAPEITAGLIELSDEKFLQQLQKTFGYRLGRFLSVGKRSSFPLQQMMMPEQIASKIVFIGNAAHTLHPIAGQGFNLGLRDVAQLCEYIIKQGINQNMLDEYQKMRQHDQQSISRMTDGLINIFESKLPGLPFARSLGLLAFEHSPWFKSLLSRYARGFAGITPDLACGIPLMEE